MRGEKRAAGLWLAALLGAICGSIGATQITAACECSVPRWQLMLADVSGDEFDASAWPTTAELEARPGTIIVRSVNHATSTIDHLHVGEP